MLSLPERIPFLKALGVALCTAESCTGGLIASTITSVSGSSDVFWGAFVTYDNSAKIALGIPQAMIERWGAVSREVAETMAGVALNQMKDALAQPGSNIPGEKILVAISTTGIAGPTGGSPHKPVGLCWIGLALQLPGEEAPRLLSRRVQAPENQTRQENQRTFADNAWTLLEEELRGLALLA